MRFSSARTSGSTLARHLVSSPHRSLSRCQRLADLFRVHRQPSIIDKNSTHSPHIAHVTIQHP
jgi:hypothetical protein